MHYFLKPTFVLILAIVFFIGIQYADGAASTIREIPPTRMAFNYEVSDDEGIRAVLLRYGTTEVITNYDCPNLVSFEVEVALLGADNQLHGLDQIIIYDCQHDTFIKYNAAFFLIHRNGTAYYPVEGPVFRIALPDDPNSDPDPFIGLNVTALPYDPKFDQIDEAELQKRIDEAVRRGLEDLRLRQAQLEFIATIILLLLIVLLIVIAIAFLMWWLWWKALGPFKKP